MKKRSTDILQRLVRSPVRKLNLQKLQEDYRISDKTLQGDIQEMQDFVHADSLTCTAHHLVLTDPEDAELVQKKLDTMGLYDYRLSLEERKYYIVLQLMCCPDDEVETMQRLADEMFVNRVTVVNDCKVVKEYLQEYSVPFLSKNKVGIRAQMTAQQKQQILINLFLELMGSQWGESAFFTRLVVRKLGFQYLPSEIMEAMTSMTQKKNLMIVHDVMEEMAICLFVLFNLAEQEPQTKMEQRAVQLDKIGELINATAKEMGQNGLSSTQIAAMEQVILQRNITPEIQSFNDFELYGVISHFLMLVGKDMGIDIQNDDLLVKSLMSHIKSMRDWESVDFDVSVSEASNALLYRALANAENHFSILEGYLHYPLDTNMRISIAIHIAAALYRRQEDRQPCRVILSCPGSMATSKYLEAQVKKYFRMDVRGIVMARKIESADKETLDADFIISTVPLRNSPLPVVVVSPLLTVEDITRIQNFILKQNGHCAEQEPAGETVLQQLANIYTSGDQKKVAYLNRELGRVLETVLKMESETAKNSRLLKMLQYKYLKLYQGELEWRDAMHMASEELIRDGYFSQNYVQKAIENVEEYGNYIIVNQGIALAHANKEAGVYQDGLSLLIARDGIQFDEGDRVYLLFFFSQKGETDYLDLFKEVIKLGNHPNDLVKLCNLKTKEEAYHLMLEMLTEY